MATNSAVQLTNETICPLAGKVRDGYLKDRVSDSDLKTELNAALKSFDKAAMAQIVQRCNTRIAALQQVLKDAAEADRAAATARTCADYEQAKDRLESFAQSIQFPAGLAAKEIPGFKSIKKAVALAIQKAGAARQAQAAAEKELTRIEKYLSDYAGLGARNYPKLLPALEAAQSAVAQRDAASLKAARKAFQDPYFSFVNLDPELANAGVPKPLREFALKHLKAPIPASKIKAMQARADAAAQAFATTSERMRQADSWFEDLEKLEVTAVPVHKAVEAIELDRKHAGELEQALVGDDSNVRKKLKALAAKARSKLSGDEMFARLRKARMA